MRGVVDGHRPAPLPHHVEAQKILAADLPSLVLYDDDTVNFATKKLKGVFSGIDTRDRWEDVSLTK